MLVYVSGPLQGASDLASARALYLRIAQAVEAAGHRAYVPHLHTDPESASGLTSASVFDRDVEALTRSDAVVAHLGAPSTGVGAELVIARDAGLRLIGLRRRGETVSRFAEGLLERAEGVLLTFDGHEDLALLLHDALNTTPGASAEPQAARSTGQAPLAHPVGSRP